MTDGRQTLSVCILARSSAGGLERILDEVDGIADEVVIGVDADSTDDTLAIATRRADVVFRFDHVGPPVRARLMSLEHARGDWILSLDEDEGLDAAFAPLLPELLSQSRYTHFWFSRKWLINREPLRYAHASPWFPDWQLRLFRNDSQRVWHPGIVHSGFRVMGAGCYEDRASVLHYEPLILSPQAREAKPSYYRAHGSDGRSERVYQAIGRVEQRDVAPGRTPLPGQHGRPRAGRVIPGVATVPPVPAAPPWGASLSVRMARECVAGTAMLVEVDARNSGRLAWEAGGVWPRLHLSCHIRRANGDVAQWDGDRYVIPRVVDPGESARFLLEWVTPVDPGEYVIEWDLVSEGECWFAACGSEIARVPLLVTAPAG